MISMFAWFGYRLSAVFFVHQTKLMKNSSLQKKDKVLELTTYDQNSYVVPVLWTNYGIYGTSSYKSCFLSKYRLQKVKNRFFLNSFLHESF